MTTLPYDEGWKIYVDGEEIEYTKALEAVIAFNIDDAGEHSIEFKYAPKTFTLGLTISVLSLGLFIFIVLFEKPLSGIWARFSEEMDKFFTKPSTDAGEENTSGTEEATEDQEGVSE